MLTPISDRLDIAKSAYISGNFAKAKTFFDGIIEEAPGSPYGIGARYLRARGYEDGVFSGKPELKKAYEDFSIVKDHVDQYGSDGLLGCARVLFESGKENNEEQIIKLCEAAISHDSNVKAMMLLGRVYELALKDGRTARLWYLRAYRHGLPWGMRFFARSHANDGNYIRSIFGHLLATVTSPFFVLVHGVRSPMK